MRCCLCFFLFLFYSVYSFAQNGNFRMPAEWEPQEAVWVGLFQRPGRDTVMAEIIKALQGFVPVRINYNADDQRSRFDSFFHGFGIDTSRLHWIKDSVVWSWMRDPGPLFLENKNGEQRVLDFAWNYYGNALVPGTKRVLNATDTANGRVDVRMAKYLGLPVRSTPIVAEGGGIESNGAGVLMTIRETALQRNPGKSLQEIEAAYKKATGATKILWLPRMTLHDKTVSGTTTGRWTAGGANGHIDEVARFVSPTTIALAKIEESERSQHPISRVDYDILEEVYATLKKARDAFGKPFTIIRFPYPDLNVHAWPFAMNDTVRQSFSDPLAHVKNGDTLYYAPAVSYMNFLITNGAVLIARYWKEGMPLREKEKDEEVRQKMQTLFPDRTIIQINPYAINRGGGGIHCATQNQPKQKK